MTGQTKAIIVSFDDDLDAEVVQKIIQSFRLYKHVVAVEAVSADPHDMANRARVRSEIAVDVSRFVDRLMGFDTQLG